MFYEKTKDDISEIKILIFIVFGMFIAYWIPSTPYHVIDQLLLSIPYSIW